MARVGEFNYLEVLRVVDIGAYVSGAKDGILLPKRFMPEGTKKGDILKVFVYHDSEDRLIATTEEPLATVGEFARLTCVDVSPHGAFLDWGLPKDLFVPKSKQLGLMRPGGEYLVRIYIDEQTGRAVASQKVEQWLSNEQLTVQEKDEVDLVAYRQTPLGWTVIVNNLHTGVLHQNEVFRDLQPGDRFRGFIKTVRPDNKLDVVAGTAGYKKVEAEGDKILRLLRENGGFLPYHDKSDPEAIYSFFGMSKKTFKMTIGTLYQNRAITMEENGIRLV